MGVYKINKCCLKLFDRAKHGVVCTDGYERFMIQHIAEQAAPSSSGERPVRFE